VGGSGDRGCEPVTQPPDLFLGRENRPILVDRNIGDGASIPVRMPVDELHFGDRKAYAQPGPFGLLPGILLLYDLDVALIGRRGDGQTEVVHVGEGEALGDLGVKAGNINNKQQRRDWGALGHAHRNRGEHFRGSLVQEPARPARQERLDLRYKVRVDPFGSKHAAEGGGVDIVEAPLYVQKECGDFPPSHLEGLHLVGEGGDRVRGRKAS